MSDTHDEAMASATEWTPLRCLEFVTSEGAVRNDAYFDKCARIITALEAKPTPTDEALAWARCHMTMTDDTECVRATDDDDGPGCGECLRQTLAALATVTAELADRADLEAHYNAILDAQDAMLTAQLNGARRQTRDYKARYERLAEESVSLRDVFNAAQRYRNMRAGTSEKSKPLHDTASGLRDALDAHGRFLAIRAALSPDTKEKK